MSKIKKERNKIPVTPLSEFYVNSEKLWGNDKLKLSMSRVEGVKGQQVMKINQIWNLAALSWKGRILRT